MGGGAEEEAGMKVGVMKKLQKIKDGILEQGKSEHWNIGTAKYLRLYFCK